MLFPSTFLLLFISSYFLPTLSDTLHLLLLRFLVLSKFTDICFQTLLSFSSLTLCCSFSHHKWCCYIPPLYSLPCSNGGIHTLHLSFGSVRTVDEEWVSLKEVVKSCARDECGVEWKSGEMWEGDKCLF